jgi:hypothetical protein
MELECNGNAMAKIWEMTISSTSPSVLYAHIVAVTLVQQI